jgi:hypothetical protein
MNDAEAPDPIDAAIEAVDPAKGEDLTEIRAEYRLTNGKRIVLIVPYEFDSDEFESAVATLVQLRVHSQALREQHANAGLVVPSSKIVGLDGKRLA